MKKIIITIIIALLAVPLFANDIEFTDPTLTKSEFENFSKELGVGLSFSPMSPAEPLGVTGFDVAAELVITDISDDEKYWKALVEDGDPTGVLVAPRIHVQKGLPFKIDIGAMYSQVPDSNIKIWGLELKYAILKGNAIVPALSIRGTYSRLEGVDDLDMDTQSGEILLSKGFLMLTPYVGFSTLRVNASENSDVVDLSDVHEIIYRGLAGIQISPVPFFVINFEASIGEATQYGMKAGIRF